MQELRVRNNNLHNRMENSSEPERTSVQTFCEQQGQQAIHIYIYKVHTHIYIYIYIYMRVCINIYA